MKELDDQTATIRMYHVNSVMGRKMRFSTFRLKIFKNELLFISGPSGAGKSTLLKLLYLGEPVSEGQVLIDGMNLSRIPRKRIPFLRRKFGIIFSGLQTHTIKNRV
jgi:cell division transport system ATP-binding protein